MPPPLPHAPPAPDALPFALVGPRVPARRALPGRAAWPLWWVLLTALLAAGCGSESGAGSGGDASASSDAAQDASLDGSGSDDASSDASVADATAGDDAGADGDDGSATPATYAIGVATVEVASAGGRKLPVELWYPATPSPGADAAKYANGLASSPFGAVRDAKALAGPWPLVMFSHGNGGIRDQSVFLTEWLARHGFVVASPEHVGNSIWSMDDKLGGVMPIWRPKDIKAVVDYLAKPDAKAPAWVAGLVKTETYAIMGHSFGGYTSLAIAGLRVGVPPAYKLDCDAADAPKELCAEVATLGPDPWDLSDPRCVLAVPLAPAGYSFGMLPKIQAGQSFPPIVLMGATGDTLTPVASEARAIYNDLPGVAALWVLTGSNHYIFSDICALSPVLPADMKKQLGTMCNPDSQPPLEAVHADIADRALAAARIWLRLEPAAIADLLAPTQSWAKIESKNVEE